MGFFKKVVREAKRVVDSPVGAVIMPYTALASAATGSKDARTSLISTYGSLAAPVAGYFGGPAAAGIAGQLATGLTDRFAPTGPTLSGSNDDNTGGGGGGGGGQYFAQPPARMASSSSIPGWVWAVGAGVVGLVVVLLIRKR